MDFVICNVTDEEELDAVLAFERRIFGGAAFARTGEYAREKWVERLAEGRDLLLYVRTGGEISAMAFARIGADGNMTAGPVATDARYRRKGLGRALLDELERRARARGVHMLTLGAVESAEDFYLKCGYAPLLFVQTKPPHTLEALRALSAGCREAWSFDDGADIRLMLITDGIDRNLQHRYDEAFPGCSTQTVFVKGII